MNLSSSSNFEEVLEQNGLEVGNKTVFQFLFPTSSSLSSASSPSSLSLSSPSEMKSEVNWTQQMRDELLSQYKETLFSLTERAKNEMIIYSILFVISVIGNLTSTCNLLKKQNRRMRMNRLVIHLTAADLMVTFITIPFEIGWRYTVNWRLGNWGCKIAQFFRQFGLYHSSMILICISIDRYYAIVHPLSITWVNQRNRRLLTAAWSVSTFFSLLEAVVYSVERHPVVPEFTQCVSLNFFSSKWMEKSYNFFCLFGLYFGPLLVIIVCYSRILKAIFTQPVLIETMNQQPPNEKLIKRKRWSMIVKRNKKKKITSRTKEKLKEEEEEKERAEEERTSDSQNERKKCKTLEEVQVDKNNLTCGAMEQAMREVVRGSDEEKQRRHEKEREERESKKKLMEGKKEDVDSVIQTVNQLQFESSNNFLPKGEKMIEKEGHQSSPYPRRGTTTNDPEHRIDRDKEGKNSCHISLCVEKKEEEKIDKEEKSDHKLNSKTKKNQNLIQNSSCGSKSSRTGSRTCNKNSRTGNQNHNKNNVQSVRPVGLSAQIVRAKRRTVRMSAIIIVAFLLCWTPYVVLVSWYQIDEKSARKFDAFTKDGLFTFAVANSCLNPLVYCSHLIKELLCSNKKRDRKTINTATGIRQVPNAPIRNSIENVV